MQPEQEQLQEQIGGGMDTTQLLKGVLDLAVLAVIKQHDSYGYDVVRQLRAAGITEASDAAVYGTLRRLHAGGFLTTYMVTSEEGPSHRYYLLSDAGRALLAESSERWRCFSGARNALLGAATERGEAA